MSGKGRAGKAVTARAGGDSNYDRGLAVEANRAVVGPAPMQTASWKPGAPIKSEPQPCRATLPS